jgi:hypothetical protein
MPDRSEQDRPRFETGVNRILRQRVIVLTDRNTSSGRLPHFEGVLKAPADRFQHSDGLRGNFRADPVTGKNGYLYLHGG